MRVEAKKLHRCVECVNAKVLRWGNDPLIAECLVKGGERFVANAITICEEWEERKKQLVVTEMGR